ncbi:MAG: transglutaminase domain-containing protein [Huintestinicola sp.]|uniref:transglutaminase domain-containing protein n=1 Tax=Huintestinicola sp. TaxID=2981661 RepID=UPI003F100D06
MEKSLYPGVAAIGALLLTAAAISASIIYVKRQSTGFEELVPAETVYTREEKAADSFERGDSFTTPYGTFTPFDSVMDINEYMTKNPVILTQEQTLPYICGENGDPEEILGTVRALSDEICRNAESDLDKAMAIAMWVGVNTAYDFDAAAVSADLSVTSLEAVIGNDFRTTCGGFANLYSALCSAQGIYCLSMKGGTSSDGYTRAQLETAPANHEWNAVFIDNKWYYADCTWISDLSYENGEISGGGSITPFYALFGFGEMSVEHRIDRCEYRDFGFAGTD